MKAKALAAAAALTLALGAASVVAAQQAGAPPARPAFAADGVVHVPAFDLPPSAFLSPEALAAQKARASMATNIGQMTAATPTIEQLRAATEHHLAPQVAALQQHYPVDITPQTIAGVPTRVIVSKTGVANPRQVLINLHGGGFNQCADACALLESIPLAGLGRFKVITVNYRQGPEHSFPAASEDVAAVYQELLKTYRPENIGIYGCSAGGALTGEVESWLQAHHLPNPGAIGIFGAGAVRFGAGDSAYVTAYTDGSFPAPTGAAPTGYFAGAHMDDPLISPALYPQIAARFPPTLLVTGTRATDMSAAIYTHAQLLKAGVDSQLLVGEGMGHCYIYQDNLPEARDAHAIIVRFFNQHLGRRAH